MHIWPELYKVSEKSGKNCHLELINLQMQYLVEMNFKRIWKEEEKILDIDVWREEYLPWNSRILQDKSL